MPDLLKALAIFGVVYIHSSVLVVQNAAITTLDDLFRFGVPVFVTMWAYFQERSYFKGRSWRSIVPSKFMALFIPFLVWSLVYSFLTPDAGRRTIAAEFSRHWLGFGWPGQYFFVIILQFIVVFPIVRRIRIQTTTLILTFALFAIIFSAIDVFSLPGVLARLGYVPFVYWLPNVVLGMYLARRPDRKLPLWAAAVGLLLILVETGVTWHHSGLNWPYFKPGVLIGSSLLAATFLTNSAKRIGRSAAFTRFVSAIGGSTMGIFVLNPLLARAGGALAERGHWHAEVGAAGSLVISLFVAGFIVAICTAATIGLKRCGLSRLVSS